jgi:hypothetical protein
MFAEEERIPTYMRSASLLAPYFIIAAVADAKCNPGPAGYMAFVEIKNFLPTVPVHISLAYEFPRFILF